MKNMFGETVRPRRLTFKNEGQCLSLFRDGRLVGFVARNGWNKKTYLLDYPFGAPVLCEYKGSLSLAEMSRIKTAWENRPKKGRR